MITIDAHHHVWTLGESSYSWLTPAAGALHRDFTLEEARPLAEAAGIDAIILVQADDDARDTARMRAISRAEPRVVGVVAYAPLHRPAELTAALEELTADPIVVGIRNLTHDRAGDEWMTQSAFLDGVAIVADAGLAVDLVGTTPGHFDAALTVARTHPEARIVLDHLMKPPLGADLRRWREALDTAAQLPNVSAKLSGLYAPGPDPAAWTIDQVREVVQVALESFGPERLMFGSDWPVVTIAGGYVRATDALTIALDGLDAGARERVWGGTAAEFYRLDPARLARIERA